MTQPGALKRGGSEIKPVTVRRLLRSRSGTSAVEFALVMLPFLMMIFGIVDFSRLVWTQSALQFAVEKTARCAAVNTSTCGTLAQIQAFAGSHTLVSGVPNTAYSYAATSCGSNVSVSTSFAFISTIVLSTSLTLKAQSCYPT